MPTRKGTRLSLKPSSKPSKRSGRYRVSRAVVLTMEHVDGPPAVLYLEASDDPDECRKRADLAGQVAYNTCIINGGNDSVCSIIRDQVAQQVYDECNAGGGIQG